MPIDSILKLNPVRFFSTPLDQSLLGEELSIDLYVRSGFRYLGLPANTPSQKLESFIQKFRNRSKLSLKNVINSSISIGYDDFVDHSDCLDHVVRLQEPKFRIIQELFWLHLQDNIFDAQPNIKSIHDDKIASYVGSDSATEMADETDVPGAFLQAHARAIINHNKAMDNELRYACDQGDSDVEYWQNALRLWYQTWSDERFWSYMQNRVNALDDPRMQVEDVGMLRMGLPKVILGFHVFWAKMYASVQREEDSLRHIQLVTHSLFADEIKQECLTALAEVVLHSRLIPLLNTFEQKLSSYTHLDWHQHANLCDDVLQEVNAIYVYLKELNFSSELIDQSGFDHLCSTILESLENKLDFSNEHKERNLLYSSLVIKKLKTLPMSTSLKRKLDTFFDKDINYLYGSFLSMEQRRSIDHTQCWFCNTEPADPDSSILIPVYKVTHIKNKSVNWSEKSILIPRSKLAEKIHDGEKEFQKLVRSANDEQSQTVLNQIHEIENRFNIDIQKCNQKCELEYDNMLLQEGKDLEDHDSLVASEYNKILQEIAGIDEAEYFRISLQYNANEAELIRVDGIQDKLLKNIKLKNENRFAAMTFLSHLKTSLPLALLVMAVGLLIKRDNYSHLSEQNPDGSMEGIIFNVFNVFHFDLFLLGVIVFFSASYLRSILTVHNARRSEKKALFHKNKKVNELNEYHAGLITQIEQDFEKLRKPLEWQLNELSHKRRLIQAYYDRMKQKIESANEKEVQIIEEKMNMQITMLTNKIKNYFNVKPKGYMKKYIPYKYAFKNGFVEGVRPSQKEIKRLAS